MELVKGWLMDAQINSAFEQIDHKTCMAICDAVGERLQQSLRPEPRLPTNLEQLLNELRKRERESGSRN